MGHNFEGDLFLLLHDVARLIRVEADKRARTKGMTRAQWVLLLRLSQRPGLSQKEAADLLEVEPITVARLVDRLVALGLIERRADEQDRRVWRLHLLPAATAMLEEIDRHRAAVADFVGAGLSDATRATMVQGLQRMKANLLLAPEQTAQQEQPAETLQETD
jgi:MarR family transcriptional regulator for hemolysin